MILIEQIYLKAFYIDMMNKSMRYLALLLLFFVSISFCADAGILKPVKDKNPGKEVAIKKVGPSEITAFKIPGQLGPETIVNNLVTGNYIGVPVHANATITALTPTVTVTPGSTVSPASGVTQDFTSAVAYIVDGVNYYSVNVLLARNATPICSGTSTTLTGDTPTPAGTYRWEILNQATGVWSAATGANTGIDYATATLSSNVNAPRLYTFRRRITIGVFTTYDSYTDLTVNQTTAISGNTINQPPAANSTFCLSGDPGTITGNAPSGGNSTYTYQWQSSTSGTFTDIGGATGPDYAPGTISTTTSYQRVVTSGACTPQKISNKVTITILPAITNNHLLQPGTTFFCGPSIPTIFNGSNPPSGGTGSFTYQWQSSTDGVNFVDLPGSSHNFDYNAPALTQTTYFRRLAKSGACSTFVPSDNQIIITIQQGLSNNTISTAGATSFCGPGDPGTIGGTQPAGGDGINYSYKWQSSPDGGTFTDISPAVTSATYSPGTVSATIYYQRLVTSGACATPRVSNQVMVTVQPVLGNNNITVPPIATFCASGSPGAIGGSIPTGGSGSYTIVWQSSVNGGPFTDIPNSNLQNYDPGLVTQTTTYQRGVTSGACGTRLYSNQVTITVQPALGGNLLTAPSAGFHCASYAPGPIQDSPPTGGDGANYTYSWESAPAIGGPYTPIANSNIQHYDPGTITQTTWFRRTVTSGLCTAPLTSNSIGIFIEPALAGNTITTPVKTTFCGSGSPGFINGSLPTGGSGSYTYVWQQSVNGGPFADIPNTNVQNYGPGLITQTTTYQRSVTSGSCTTPIISGQVTITIQQALVGNTLTPPAKTQFCGTGDAGLITGSTPTGGDGSPLYQWQQSPDNVDAHFTDINGQTGKDFNPPLLTTTTFYRRVVTELTCSTPLISAAVEIHITPPITFSSILVPPFPYCVSVDPQPISGSPPQGGDGGNTYLYTWYTSTDMGATWTLIPGANQIDYDPPTITTTTSYRRDVISGACQVPFPSNVATIIVNQTPANAIINTVAPICAGNTATISITSPDATLTYIWYDSSDKSNAVFQGTSFVTPVLNASQTYYVEASNGTCASPVLTPVAITVNTVPAAPPLQTNPASTCVGSPAVLNILNPQAGLTYNWYTAATGGTAVFTGADFATPVLTGNTTYYVDATSASGCTSISRTVVFVSAIPLPTISAQGDNVCPGAPATLVSNNTDLDVTVNWYATATGGTILFTGNSFIPPPVNANTTYYAEAVNNNCVSATRAAAQVQIIQPLPAPVPQATALKAPNITFEWAPVSGADGYLVSTDGGQTFTEPNLGSSATTYTVTGLQIGQSVTLIVRSTGDVSCKESANSSPVTAIAVNPLIDQVFVANAFTPNGDGKNDVVYVHNENIKTLKFYVYSQWGELLFMSQSQQKGWDGTFKGKPEPAGVYVYYVEITLTNGENVNKKGTITLLR